MPLIQLRLSALSRLPVTRPPASRQFDEPGICPEPAARGRPHPQCVVSIANNAEPSKCSPVPREV
jgi:hypothetical protein